MGTENKTGKKLMTSDDLPAKDAFARIKSIEFINFRNIDYGKVVFPNTKYNDFKADEPSILGLYGQNGSGKTSVIMALRILKYALSGAPLNDRYLSSIEAGYEKCSLKYEIVMYDVEKKLHYDISYAFELETNEEIDDEDEEILQKHNKRNIKKHLSIVNECLSWRITDFENNLVVPQQIFIDTRESSFTKKGYAFGNKAKYEMIMGKNSENDLKLRDLKAIAYSQSKSFIFANSVANVIDETAPEDVNRIYAFLKIFGSRYLMIVDNFSTGVVNINQELPLFIWLDSKFGPETGAGPINMTGLSEIPEELYPIVKTTLESISSVLTKIIPGLSLEIKDYGTVQKKEETTWHMMDVISVRNGVNLPLRFESDGVRRIISILSLLIAVYNQHSLTVAIDEVDSGIYEYLLGEIIGVMNNGAKGQLVFTSHNLRPLEVLPSKYLCFTTTNPDNRFIKLPEKRGNSNLRDTYFRNIILGNQKEPLYCSTDSYDIEMAFYEAGKVISQDDE